MDSELRPSSKQAPQPLSVVAMTLELAVIAVSDVERSKRFYTALGWRFDIDFQGDDYRIVQFTPPGSSCSVMFGQNITKAPAGSSRGLHLVVSDLPDARSDLLSRGVETSEPFHDVGGIFHHSNGVGIKAGLNPERKKLRILFRLSRPGWKRVDCSGDHGPPAWAQGGYCIYEGAN